MSQSNVAGWLPSLIGPVQIKNNGAPVPARGAINFMGCSFSDDGSNTIITPNAPTILAPDGTTFATISGQVSKTSNPNSPSKEYDVNVITPTTAATPIFQLATVANRQYTVRGIIRVMNSPQSAFAAWDLSADVRNSSTGPTVEIFSTAAPISLKGPAGTSFVLTFTLVSGVMTLTATDPVGGRRWTGSIYVVTSVF